jgi:hypothetical protein
VNEEGRMCKPILESVTLLPPIPPMATPEHYSGTVKHIIVPELERNIKLS